MINHKLFKYPCKSVECLPGYRCRDAQIRNRGESPDVRTGWPRFGRTVSWGWTGRPRCWWCRWPPSIQCYYRSHKIIVIIKTRDCLLSWTCHVYMKFSVKFLGAGVLKVFLYRKSQPIWNIFKISITLKCYNYFKVKWESW